MYMLLVADVLVVETVDADVFFAMRGAEERDEVTLEVVAEILDVLLRVLADNLQFPNMGFGLDVALEAVGVAALLLAYFAPPPCRAVSFVYR